MPSYRDLFEVHLRYADYIREKSLLVHQYVRNITASGTGVEIEIRGLLQSVLPSRFKVTSGYIVGADSREDEPAVSPQLDVIVVDTLVPHSLWVVDTVQGIEIVPRECVVAVIEVKRTLSSSTIKAAVDHLARVVSSVGLRKDDPTALLPGGSPVSAGLLSPYRGNPLLGIIGLAAESTVESHPAHDIVTYAKATTYQPFIIDFILAISGTFAATSHPDGTYVPLREQSELSQNWAASITGNGKGGRVALAHGLGFIQAYIQQTCGRVANAEHYFFNAAIE